MTVKTPLALLAATVLSLALAACSKDAPEAAAAGEGEHAEAGGEDHDEGAAKAVVMDAAALKAAGIVLAAVQPTTLSEDLRAPGEVVDNAYGTTLITPRVESLVVRRHARLGDEVRAGAPLVTLSSVEVADAQANLKIAEQEWARVSALGREAVSGRRITEAQVAVERARATARGYGLPGTAAGRSNGEFTLTAPHAGRITEDEFVVGERIEPGKTLFRLVDESVVWVDAKLPSGMEVRIAPGSQATVVIGGQRVPGKVLRSAHRTSDATRNASVRIEVRNDDDRLHGGDFVEVFFEAAGATAPGQTMTPLAVPTDAIVQIEGDTVVFRRDDKGALAPVTVRLGEVIGDRTVIREGLKPGDVVVVAGAFAVKSQILKAQLGEGHGH
jgi:cobalt-zinc-cadmium efflux system membrane fusion protein